jgi:hypothetical protein
MSFLRSSKPKELIIPQVARADKDAYEVARVWVARKDQHVSLNVGVWKDPAAWGILLSDLAKHVANAYVATAGMEFEDALSRISAGLIAELSSPTEIPKGKIEI